MAHPVAWHTAAPLWALSLADSGNAPARFRRPALLRFEGDDFMQQLQAALAQAPAALAGFVARAESWDYERAGWRSEAAGGDDPDLLLYQPAHHRHYLLAAALVCQMPGLPERGLDIRSGERCSFVMRRLAPRPGLNLDPADPTTYDELAWTGGQQKGLWRAVVRSETVLPDEERLPLFPQRFRFESAPRTLWCGLIPVGRRDAYEAGAAAVAPPAPAAQQQADTFSSEAAAGAYQLLDKAWSELGSGHDASGGDEAALRAQKKASFAFALLDLADFLQRELPALWQALGVGSPAGLPAAQATVYAALDTGASGSAGKTWRGLLREVDAATLRAPIEDGSVTAEQVDTLLGAALERAQLAALADQLRNGGQLRDQLIAAIDPRVDGYVRDVSATWPGLAAAGLGEAAAQDALLGLLLRLADFLQAELPRVWSALAQGTVPASAAEQALRALLVQPLGSGDWAAFLVDADLHRKDILAGQVTPATRVIGERLSAAIVAATLPLAAPLEAAVRAALAAAPLPSRSSAQALVRQQAQSTPLPADASARYVLRCVYERPACAAVHDPVLSEPSAPFQLASFFDAGAPVRPLRIEMPRGTLAQLRRGAKGVSIATSKELRTQVDRARNAGLKGLVEQNVGGGTSFDFGLVCQLSIPIITICAFILLMIIVQLLNIIFFWIPYFIICLPRIGKKG